MTINEAIFVLENKSMYTAETISYAQDVFDSSLRQGDPIAVDYRG